MVDSIYRTRSLGVAAEGLPDQYADGKAAKVWEHYIGSKQNRTEAYRQFLIDLLHQHKCKSILDVACGTGFVFFPLASAALFTRDIKLVCHT